MIKIRKGNPAGVRDNLDIRLFCNNYIGFHVTIYGYGIWCSFKIHDVKL